MTNTSGLPDIRRRLGDRYAIAPHPILLIDSSLNVHLSLETKAEFVTAESHQPTRATLGTGGWPATATPTHPMRSLEDRVAALERWRDGANT